eukprot:gnl/Trimastix_PCT/75.p1 GENE.gnl/Trimastix_PCT/75~~gnl/Trimastix_PCT/75.p1  ORF type:complete len:517 (-),score=72.23 gnl/Trimastix_PCT/75:450-2000(-)
MLGTFKGWIIERQIGKGAFGEIFVGTSTQSRLRAAIKVEKAEAKKTVLKLESLILRRLQNSQHVCRFYSFGHHERRPCLVMELLGENISTLRRQCGGKFSLGTTIRLGTQMVRAVEAIHRIGYLHRDVKPSNFAIGRGERRTTIVLFDFGLARRYKNERGDIRAPRNDVGFRGTARYASLRAHEGKELSRADDLWSVLYILTECLVGRLPWHYVKDRDEIGKMKREFLNPSLVAELPAEFRLFLDHLLALGYTARPDYDALCLALEELGHREDVLMRPLDWELVSTPPGAASNKAPIHTPDGAHTLVSPSRALDDGPRLHPTSPSHPTLLSPHHRALVARYHKFSPHDNSLETPVLRLHPPGWKHAPRGPGPPCLSSEEEPSLGTAFSSQPDPSPSMASISYCESVRSLPRSPLQPVWSPSLLGSARPPAPPLPPPPPPPPSTPPPDGTPISSRSAASTRSRRTPHGGSVHRLARVGPPPPGNEEESLLPSDSSAPGGSPSPLLFLTLWKAPARCP